MPRMSAWTWAAVTASALVAVQGSAASLREVRVGSHADFTRVVLETDAPVRYELTRTADGELRVRLFATASPRRLGSKSKLLKEVVVESDASGSVARLALRKRADVDVKEMVLDKPPRIVLDLTQRAGGAAPEPKLAKAEPAPAPTAEPPAPAAEPAPVEEPQAEAAPSEPAPEAAAAEPEPAAEADDAPAEAEKAAPTPEAAPDDQAARDAAAQAELDRLAGIVPAPKAEAAAAAPTEEPAAAPDDAPAAGEDEGADPADVEGYDAEEPQVAATPPRTLAPRPGGLSFLPSPLDDPLVLGVVSALLLVVAVLALLRRRSARAADAAGLASPFASSEAFALPGAGSLPVNDAAMGPLFANAAEREQESADASIFDVAEGDASASDDYEPEGAPYADPGLDAAPSAATSYMPDSLQGDDMRLIEELTRRLAHLETRLEEVVDAKERLERHVAAQTEELRVQRAAIARTQRVLRTVVKPDDLATEPAPKT